MERTAVTLRPTKPLIALLVSTLFATPALAIIHVDSPLRNTDAPTDGSLAAWNLQGQLGDFTGTPIAPSLFIASVHASVSGANRDFWINDKKYVTLTSYDLGSTDLRIFQLDPSKSDGNFGDDYAKLYDATNSGSEVGKPMFVAGRGVARGADYTVGDELRGWYWGTGDTTVPPRNEKPLSWGQSTVAEIANSGAKGNLLAFDFASPDGIAMTGGDSGGGLFVLDGGEWKLAGVNYAIDGRWSKTKDGPYEIANLFDARGLWVGTSSANGVQLDEGNEPIPASSYSSRISSNRAAINAVFLATGNAALVPEPGTLAAIALLTIAVRRRRR
jgi:hypothetical protein